MTEEDNRSGFRTDLPRDQVTEQTSADELENGFIEFEEEQKDLPPLDDETFNQEFDEETAAEVAPRIDEANYQGVTEDDDVSQRAEGRAVGWTGLILSGLSLFFLPLLLATAGIVCGYFAYRGGARALGLWSIGIGAFSLITGLFFVPLITS